MLYDFLYIYIIDPLFNGNVDIASFGILFLIFVLLIFRRR